MTWPQTDNSGILLELVAGCDHLLLDFDGPVCRLFAGIPAPTIAASLLDHLPLALHDRVRSTDPHEVLRLVHRVAPRYEPVVERMLSGYEVEAAATAIPTPHAHRAIATARSTGRTVSIVTNNSEAAVDRYLVRHRLGQDITAVAARAAGGVPEMKPDPALVRQAIAQLETEPSRALLVGNSATDITAARAAGVRAVGFADRPGKHDALRQADLVVDDLADLVAALRDTAVDVGS